MPLELKNQKENSSKWLTKWPVLKGSAVVCKRFNESLQTIL